MPTSPHHLLFLATTVTFTSCGRHQRSAPWLVKEMEIPLYHSSTVDPESGNIFHVEYCAAKITAGDREVHIVYRPIDFPDRDPGFAEGDAIAIDRLETAEDFGALDGLDYWISDVDITPHNKRTQPKP